MYRIELDRLKRNNEDHKKSLMNNGSAFEKFKVTFNRLCRKEFLKPFLFLNLIWTFGLNWAGFAASWNPAPLPGFASRTYRTAGETHRGDGAVAFALDNSLAGSAA